MSERVCPMCSQALPAEAELPPMAQMNIGGWTFGCDECGKTQHFEHMSRERASAAARAAGWALLTKISISHPTEAAQLLEYCPGCAKEHR